MKIEYKTGLIPDTDDIIAVYESSGINRPTRDSERIQQMYANSNLVISAWDGEQLVGISRSITDYFFSCYLSDLAVRKEYQHEGIGRQLVLLTQETIGDNCMLLLLSAPTAMEYYPKIGMEKVNNGFIFNRKNKN